MTVSRTSPDGQCRNQIEAGNEQAEISLPKQDQEPIVVLAIKLIISNVRVKLKKSTKRNIVSKYNINNTANIIYKINSKQIKILNIGDKTIKFYKTHEKSFMTLDLAILS